MLYFNSEGYCNACFISFRLHIVHILTQVATVFFLWRFLFSRSNTLRNIWRRVLELLTRAARLLAIA